MAKETSKAPRKTEEPSATVTPKGTDRAEYVVQKKAPSRVAGRRVQPGDVLSLTEYEARSELQQMHILAKPTAEQA